MSAQFANDVLVKPGGAARGVSPSGYKAFPPIPQSYEVHEDNDDAHMSIVHGIVVAILLSAPFWALLGLIVYLLW